MRITYTELPRDEVLVALGPHWPAQPGATVALVGETVSITHGAVAVHHTEDQPGITWWAVDGLIVPQDAGPPPTLPGVLLAEVPAPTADAPPLTP